MAPDGWGTEDYESRVRIQVSLDAISWIDGRGATVGVVEVDGDEVGGGACRRGDAEEVAKSW